MIRNVSIGWSECDRSKRMEWKPLLSRKPVVQKVIDLPQQTRRRSGSTCRLFVSFFVADGYQRSARLTSNAKQWCLCPLKDAAGSLAERTSFLCKQSLLRYVKQLDKHRYRREIYARKGLTAFLSGWRLLIYWFGFSLRRFCTPSPWQLGTNHLHTVIMQLCERKTEVAEKLVSVWEEKSHYVA